MAWSVFLTNPPCNAVGHGLSVLVLHQVLGSVVGACLLQQPIGCNNLNIVGCGWSLTFVFVCTDADSKVNYFEMANNLRALKVKALSSVAIAGAAEFTYHAALRYVDCEHDCCSHGTELLYLVPAWCKAWGQ